MSGGQAPFSLALATMTDKMSVPEDVLVALAALLGVNYVQEGSGSKVQSNCPLDWSCIPWEPCSNNANGSDQEGPDINFSSFPSLSLDRSKEEPDGYSARETRRDVEAHVSALLSRPILVSTSSDVLPEEEDADSTDFMAGEVSEVPGLVLDNFYKSFTTLMNSRLRAYAKFLANHGLTLLRSAPSSSSTELEEGVVGVEQKLETMLDIGRRVSTTAVVTAFQAKKKDAIRKELDDETTEVSMAVVMDAAIDISLPRPGGEGSEAVTVTFQTTGTITGIFMNASEASLLRVVGVDLDMSELLACMIEQAASVISCIIDMTNATYSMALPLSLDAAQGAAALENNRRKRKASPSWVEPDVAVVSPPLQPRDPVQTCDVQDIHLADESDGSESSELTAEGCEYLLDVVLNETNDSILSSPSQKRMKMAEAATVPPLP